VQGPRGLGKGARRGLSFPHGSACFIFNPFISFSNNSAVPAVQVQLLLHAQSLFFVEPLYRSKSDKSIIATHSFTSKYPLVTSSLSSSCPTFFVLLSDVLAATTRPDCNSTFNQATPDQVHSVRLVIAHRTSQHWVIFSTSRHSS